MHQQELETTGLPEVVQQPSTPGLFHKITIKQITKDSEADEAAASIGEGTILTQALTVNTTAISLVQGEVTTIAIMLPSRVISAWETTTAASIEAG